MTATDATNSAITPGTPKPVSDVDLSAAMDYCRDITRTRARNFYYGLKLTPEPKRSALYAVYAFMRYCDDLADDAVEQGDAQAGIERIESFRQQMQSVLDGGPIPNDESMLWQALAHVMRTYPIDPAHLHAMLDGQHADMIKHRYDTFVELDHYCYNVAGTVGLVCISVWGHDGDSEIESIARSRGLALQLTNILRDVVEDTQRGRVYLPADELARFGCDEKQLVAGGPGFDAMMDFQIKRAQACYEASAALEAHLDPACRGTSWAMMRIYRGLLDKIAANPRRVLHQRVRLSAWEKTRIALTARWK